jgi:hypothetical protein
MSKESTVTEKSKRGRRRKTETEEHKTLISLRMWEDEYELFSQAAKPGSMAAFLRTALEELLNAHAEVIASPSEVPRNQGAQFTMLLTDGEKATFGDAAANRFDLPLSGLIRAAGMRKVSKTLK